MLEKGRANELPLRFLLWGLIAFSYCGVRGKDLRGTCQRQEAFPPAKFPALTFSPFSSLRLRGGAVRSCSSASPGSNRKLEVDNDEADSSGGDAEANYGQSDGNSRGGLPEHFSDTARSGRPGGTKDVGRGRPSSDRYGKRFHLHCYGLLELVCGITTFGLPLVRHEMHAITILMKHPLSTNRYIHHKYHLIHSQ